MLCGLSLVAAAVMMAMALSKRPLACLSEAGDEAVPSLPMTFAVDENEKRQTMISSN